MIMFSRQLLKHQSLYKLIMQGFLEEKRRQGRPRTNWMSNFIEWTKSDIGNLLEYTLDHEKWKKTCVIAAIQYDKPVMGLSKVSK